MSELGIISQNVLSIKQMQMSLIKQQAQMQQKTVEILVEGLEVSPDPKGQAVDKCL